MGDERDLKGERGRERKEGEVGNDKERKRESVTEGESENEKEGTKREN